MPMDTSPAPLRQPRTDEVTNRRFTKINTDMSPGVASHGPTVADIPPQPIAMPMHTLPGRAPHVPTGNAQRLLSRTDMGMSRDRVPHAPVAQQPPQLIKTATDTSRAPARGENEKKNYLCSLCADDSDEYLCSRTISPTRSAPATVMASRMRGQYRGC